MTILCIASYEKGHEFLREARRQGCRVVLVTSASVKDSTNWPMEAIDEIFYMHDREKKWDRDETIRAISFLCRTRVVDRLVPLDDFDLEMAASLREHLRIPGMGETTTRYFRDKLAMRMKAAEAGLMIPDFVHILNHDRIREFTERVSPPWVLKPRLLAGAIGIKKVHSAEELWQLIDSLGDDQSNYLLERYVPGEICHVDSIVYEHEIQFAIASQYGKPPLDVSHEGGIFTTRILERGSGLEQALLEKNRRVLKGLGLLRGVSHTEYIHGTDGQLYFLETAARVGGAHIADLVEAASGLNLWAEWAQVEIAGGKGPYAAIPQRADYAGLLISLAKVERPDTSAYTDPEIVWRMERPHHVGLIFRSHDAARIRELLHRYTVRVQADFHAVLPPRERPSN